MRAGAPSMHRFKHLGGVDSSPGRAGRRTSRGDEPSPPRIRLGLVWFGPRKQVALSPSGWRRRQGCPCYPCPGVGKDECGESNQVQAGQTKSNQVKPKKHKGTSNGA